MRDLFAFQLHELINSSGERVFSQLTREMLFRRLSRVSVVNRYLLSKVKIPRSCCSTIPTPFVYYIPPEIPQNSTIMRYIHLHRIK